MKFYDFSFKNEAMWMVISTLVELSIGGVILLAVYLIRGY